MNQIQLAMQRWNIRPNPLENTMENQKEVADEWPLSAATVNHISDRRCDNDNSVEERLVTVEISKIGRISKIIGQESDKSNTNFKPNLNKATHENSLMDGQSSTILLDMDERGNHQEYNKICIDYTYYRVTVDKTTKAIRLAFLRKIFGLLTMHMLITVSIWALIMFTPAIRKFVAYHGWIVLLCLFGSLLLTIPLFYYKKKTPINLILLTAFVICQAIMTGIIAIYFSEVVVVKAVLTTLIVFGGLSLYTFQSRLDYSSWYSLLFASIVILIVGSVLQIYMPSTTKEAAVSYCGALILCVYIIIDTSIIMTHLSAEEYVLATVTLYLDIVYLFLHLLRED